MADKPDTGIALKGRAAELKYCHYTGAARADRASKGDVVLDDHYVEIKKASSTTVNQVRAVKYITLVVFYTPTDTSTGTWYVVPACDVVRLVAPKERGQHTEIAFECATLSVTQLEDFRVDDPSNLLGRTRAAIEKSAAHPELESEMHQVCVKAKALAVRSRQRVSKLLGQ